MAAAAFLLQAQSWSSLSILVCPRTSGKTYGARERGIWGGQGDPPEWSHYMSGLRVKKKQIARRNQFRGKLSPFFVEEVDGTGRALARGEIDILGEDCLIKPLLRAHPCVTLGGKSHLFPVLFLLLLQNAAGCKTGQVLNELNVGLDLL